MTTERALARREMQETQIEQAKPKEVVAQAKEQADALMDIVKQRKLYQDIQGKQYLQVEAWQTIGRFNGATAATEYVKPIEVEGKVLGYEAKVVIYRRGGIEGAAIASCGLDEYVCRGKSGFAQVNACQSMAQTRAVSKAFRMTYSYVAVLAGFEPTPAEEMHEDKSGGAASPAQKSPYCEVHKTEFFKKGKMRTFAHKLPDGSWCNMPEGKPIDVEAEIVDDVIDAAPPGEPDMSREKFVAELKAIKATGEIVDAAAREHARMGWKEFVTKGGRYDDLLSMTCEYMAAQAQAVAATEELKEAE